jgi:HPt (histidine-containing phosphotransfer) domain-containing protein
MGGSADLYLKVVKSFVRDTANMAEQLAGHLDRNEKLESARLMHTLKGLSATMGATPLASVAAQVEAAIKSDNIPGGAQQLVQQVRSAMDTTLRTLEILIRELERPAAGTVASGEDQPRSPLMDRSALRKLHALLASSDMDAMRVHAELIDSHDTQMGDTLNALNEAMSNLDFARAAAECKKLLDVELSP